MATTLTTDLSLTKPTPGTHEPATIAMINTNMDALDALFNASTGHDHSGAHKGKPIPSAGIASGVTLTAPHMTSPVVDSGTLSATASDIIGKRFKAAGTALANGDFALSAGWGSTATAVAGAGADARGIVVVTAGGTGIAANPTITLTFKDGTWTTSPIVLCQLTGGSGIGTAVAIGITPTTTAVVFQPFFTPVSGNSYNFSWIAVGGPT